MESGKYFWFGAEGVEERSLVRREDRRSVRPGPRARPRPRDSGSLVFGQQPAVCSRLSADS